MGRALWIPSCNLRSAQIGATDLPKPAPRYSPLVACLHCRLRGYRFADKVVLQGLIKLEAVAKIGILCGTSACAARHTFG